MKLTDRYVDLCRQLADAGYVWHPRPGDWMLDLMDDSIGMLTTAIKRPELLIRVNVQLPYGEQITALLESSGVRVVIEGDEQRWIASDGSLVYACSCARFVEAPDEEALAALVEEFRRQRQTQRQTQSEEGVA